MTDPVIDARALRDAFGAFITGVTVVTAHHADGRPLGFTANSFSSVSLDPPLLCVCLAKTSSNFEAMTEARGFAVNILSEDQKAVSNTFASRVPDRFADVEWEAGPHGAPILPESAAWFDCSTHQIVDAGDHVMLLGRVEAFKNNGHSGLGYARGSYFTSALAKRAVEAAGSEGETVLGAVVERAGSILLLEAANGKLALPTCRASGDNPIEGLVAEIAARTGLTAEIGFLYSVYEERGSNRQHIVYRASVSEGEPLGGGFFDLSDLPLERIDRPQSVDIVKRFRAESELGQFAIYFGNETDGRIHSLTKEHRP
ncbi:flavin reductase [Fulvimarina endophytica]|uniref:Flavin reductase n=1 Tax=Fulvimarina endophytica TaxID=2293836 RepID=A0A371WZ05_9HYPH|nr:flavin reductase [Fulvimarina endophytica]RFC62213.1 flavin reductase [Fulvimarina endophytica]